MNRSDTRRAAVLAVLMFAAACHKANDDPTRTASQGGMTAKMAARTDHARRELLRRERVAPSGTEVTAVSEQTISSRSSHAGQRVVARVELAVLSAAGDTVIPYGAELVGRVSEIRPAPHPDQQGALRLAFDSVRVGGQAMPVEVKVDSMRAVMRGRGVTTTDAAKVGAGAVIGGIAGRLIGGNRTGTIVGAAAGGAAGGVVAHNTRTVDIVLPAGSAIHLELTAPFKRPEAAVASSR